MSSVRRYSVQYQVRIESKRRKDPGGLGGLDNDEGERSVLFFPFPNRIDFTTGGVEGNLVLKQMARSVGRLVGWSVGWSVTRFFSLPRQVMSEQGKT